MEKLLLDVTETAKLLGLSRSTIYNLMRREENPIPFFIVGGCRRKIKVSDLEKWLEKEKGSIK